MSQLLIHRGLAKNNFKENTITAFRYCFKKKYGIETDIHSTKDNKIVCFHDFNLKGKFKIEKTYSMGPRVSLFFLENLHLRLTF